MEGSLSLLEQHTSRCTGECTVDCRDGTGLVAVVVLTLRYLLIAAWPWTIGQRHSRIRGDFTLTRGASVERNE
eukprot:scaffold114719_cov41-Tisochrysis_lutea.AAC.1